MSDSSALDNKPPQPPARRRRASDQPEMREFTDFLRQVCGYLLQCGCSSNRVELLTTLLGESWGFEVETLAIPTGVWISVRHGGTNIVELTRVRSWSVDLDRLSRLNDLVESIHDHEISIQEASERIKAEAKAKSPYGILITLLAGGGQSPVLVFGYGGTPLEVALAFPIGLTTQFLQKYVFTAGDRRYIAEFVSAAVVAALAVTMQLVFPTIDLSRLIVGGIVALVPGLVLVNAVHEVAQKNLVSGAAKLLEAFVIAASLGSGVLFVLGLKTIILG